MAVPSATKTIRSSHIPTMWLFHLPQGNNISPSHKVAIPSATDGNNISHHIFGNNISHHIFGNNISQQQVVITSTTIKQIAIVATTSATMATTSAIDIK